MMTTTNGTKNNGPVVFDPVTMYAQQVVDGNIIAGEPVRLQCARHLEDLKNGESRGLYWDVDAGMKPVRWMSKNIIFTEGEFAGRHFIPDQYQIFIIGSVFGWKRSDNGYRRFKYIYVETGKGSGKSPMLAGLGLYCLMEDDEPNSMILAGASARDQAKIIFDDALGFVDVNPDIDKRVTTAGNYIKYKRGPGDQSKFLPVSSQARNLSGKRPSVVFIDEYHEHPDDSVEDALKKGFKHRRQPLMFITTNAGSDLMTACGRWHQRVMNILRGVYVDDTVFGYICALDKGDDYTDESVWLKTNPLIGNGYNVEYLRDLVRESIQMPSKQASCKRLSFCVWTAQGESWLDPLVWDELVIDIPEAELVGRGWGEGIDLSELKDVTALNRLFVLNDGRLFFKPKFFLPQSAIDKNDDVELVVMYQQWSTSGALPNDHPDYEPWLNILPGDIIDHDDIVEEVLDDIKTYGGNGEDYNIPYDQYRMRQPALKIEKKTQVANMIEFQQTHVKMNEPCMTLEQKMVDGTILNDGNPMMKWMIGNVVLNENSKGLVHPDKKKSPQKIDGVSALLMALGSYIFPEEEKIKMSVYDDPHRNAGFRRLEW